MKIALVSPFDYSYPGGVTTHISQLERCFREMGHQVRILAPCSRPAPHFSSDVIPLGRPIPIPSGGSFARVALSPRLLLQVRGVLERESFDIVHAHDPLTPVLPPAVLTQARVPKVGTFHAYHRKARGYFLFKPVLSRWFQHLDALIAVSEPARDFASRHFPGDYCIIPNGVDTRAFSPSVSPRPELAGGKRNLLFVGRQEKRKGLDYLLDAFRVVKRRCPQARLVVVGPRSRLGMDYRALAGDMEDVVFCDQVHYTELPGYYAAAEIVCSPATGEESFGMVLLEAMASGKPVVASRIPGFLQVLTPGEEGIAVPPRDPAALADALLYLLEHPEEGREMAQRGVEKAQRYDWGEIARQVLAVYRRLLG